MKYVFLDKDEVEPLLQQHYPIFYECSQYAHSREVMQWAEETFGYRNAVIFLGVINGVRNYDFHTERKFAIWCNFVYFATATEYMIWKMNFPEY